MTKAWRILVVDDDQQMVRTLVDILRLKGYQVHAAHSGPEALDKVKKVHFCCVLTDVRMPEMDGADLVRAIKAMQPDVAVVLMTAYSIDKLAKEGLEEGAVAALSKPLDINTLLRLLSALCEEESTVIADDDLSIQEARGE